MAGPQPEHVIAVSTPQQAVLEALQRQASCPQALALRIRIVLGATSGQRNGPLALALGCSGPTVRTWRARWAAAEAQLALAEADPSALRQVIASVLADSPRSGTPSTFSAEQIVQIVNLACTSPRAVGRPVDAWTPRELADEAEHQGIVTSISPTTIGRFLGRSRSPTASEPLLAQRQDQSR
jgi:putative transposase